MGKDGILWGAIGTGVFAGSIMVLMPPTSLKASQSSAAIPRAASAPVAAAAEPASYAPVPQLYHLDDRGTDREAAYTEPYAVDPDTREEMEVAAHDRAYGDGYAWAADQGVDQPDACRALRGDRREGCLDYVTSL